MASPQVEFIPENKAVEALAGIVAWAQQGWAELSSSTYRSGELPRFWYGLVGGLSQTSPWVRRTLRRGQHRWAMTARRLDSLSAQAASWPMVGRLLSQRAAWNQTARARFQRWVTVGLEHESRGRRLTMHAFHFGLDAVVRQVARSTDLQDVIRTASSGLTDDTLTQVRRRGARADQLAEALVRRMLRRPSRSEPPPGPTTPSPEG